MSRFYDALKEAGRFKPLNGTPPPVNGEAPVTHNDTSSLLQDLSGELSNFATNGATALYNPPEENQPFDIPQNGTLNNTVAATLDPRARLITNAADSVVVEYYRRLRTKLLQEHAAKPFQRLVVASPNPQEGKTVTVMNLGLSFSSLPSFKVLIVDGDMRKGSLGKCLGVDGRPGLSNLVEGTAGLDDVVLSCDEFPMKFMLRGNSPAPSGELLNSPALKRNLDRLVEHFDLILVDSPALNMITDAQLLAHCCDAVLLVARAFSTTRKAFEKAIHDLQAFRIVGAVLNGGTRAPHYRKYSKYY